MKKLLLALTGLTLCVAPIHAQEAKPAPPAEFKPILNQLELNDGDTLVFLGDSITHQCLYTQYIETYFYTRFPDRRIRFHNAGVSGDRAADALLRFDLDVAEFKPKYVTILLGMNDGRYTNFNADIFGTYEKDMSRLLDKIGGAGAFAVPMTPTMFDARAARMSKKGPSEPRDTYYNPVLAYFGEWLREQAFTRGLGFVDMHSPLNNLTTEQRKTNPAFTLIKDAIHPDAPGQVVMAVAILEDMVAKGPVSAITLQPQPNGKLRIQAANGKASDLLEGDSIQFTFKANALPWVLPPEAAEGYKLAKAGHRHSSEKLTVGGLKPGQYAVRIDGAEVGRYSHAQLARGMELQENDKTPQYQQALKVAMLNKERNDKTIRPLRNLWLERKRKRADEQWLAQNPNHAEAPAKREALNKWIEEFKVQALRLLGQATDYENQIYKANEPQTRKYEIVAVQ